MKKKLLCCLFLLLFSSLPAHASSVEFSLGEVFSGKTPPDSTGPWLTASFVDVGDGDVKLTLTGNMTGSMFISKLYFNYDGTDLADLVFTDSGAVNIQTGLDSFNADGIVGHNFDIYFQFPTGDKDDRFQKTDTVSYLISSKTDLLIDSDYFLQTNSGGEYYSAAHLQGLTDNESTWIGAKTATVVPIPATAYLLGSGIIGLVSFRRNIKKGA